MSEHENENPRGLVSATWECVRCGKTGQSSADAFATMGTYTSFGPGAQVQSTCVATPEGWAKHPEGWLCGHCECERGVRYGEFWRTK